MLLQDSPKYVMYMYHDGKKTRGYFQCDYVDLLNFLEAAELSGLLFKWFIAKDDKGFTIMEMRPKLYFSEEHNCYKAELRPLELEIHM